MKRTKKLLVMLTIIAFLMLLFIYGHRSWPIAFDWDEKAGFKSAYLDLPHAPVLSKTMNYILVPQSKHFIAAEFRRAGWKAGRGTWDVATLGGIPIVFGLSGTGYSKTIDPYKTELMYAAENGDLESVRNLIKTGAKIDEQNQNGLTPLIYATRGPKCSLKVVRALVSAGVNIDIRDKEGNSALIGAAGGSDCLESAQILIAAGADVNARTNLGETPLMSAALSVADENSAMDIVRTLIAAGADINARDSNGDTALSISVHRGRTGIAKLLTERSGKKENSWCSSCGSELPTNFAGGWPRRSSEG